MTGPTQDTRGLAEALIDLGRLALIFAGIDRTAVYHLDGVTPESDADHTVMLGWIAGALAARCFPGLDVGLVAQFALVHDAVEVYAGDTPTLRIDQAGLAEKASREHAAAERIDAEFGASLPWFPRLIGLYEAQQLPEARFVRGVDKILPKIVHLLDGCTGLARQRMGRTELAAVFERQATDMTRYVGEFAALLDLRAELVERVLARPEVADDSDGSVSSVGARIVAGAPVCGRMHFPSECHLYREHAAIFTDPATPVTAPEGAAPGTPTPPTGRSDAELLAAVAQWPAPVSHRAAGLSAGGAA
jgi:5'-deoxynucleotidase YfbR-like HD superfamily hydrolase